MFVALYILQKAVKWTLLRLVAALPSMSTTVLRPFLGQPESKKVDIRKLNDVSSGGNRVRERRTPTGLLTAEERRKSAVKLTFSHLNKRDLNSTVSAT